MLLRRDGAWYAVRHHARRRAVLRQNTVEDRRVGKGAQRRAHAFFCTINRWWARCALPTLLLIASAHAQTYPTRPIRVIVGPGPDIVARLFAPKMSAALGGHVIVEPRPGAGGVIAAQAVANAPADGY